MRDFFSLRVIFSPAISSQDFSSRNQSVGYILSQITDTPPQKPSGRPLILFLSEVPRNTEYSNFQSLIYCKLRPISPGLIQRRKSFKSVY